jgi:hypothetical protein
LRFVFGEEGWVGTDAAWARLTEFGFRVASSPSDWARFSRVWPAIPARASGDSLPSWRSTIFSACL